MNDRIEERFAQLQTQIADQSAQLADQSAQIAALSADRRRTQQRLRAQSVALSLLLPLCVLLSTLTPAGAQVGNTLASLAARVVALENKTADISIVPLPTTDDTATNVNVRTVRFSNVNVQIVDGSGTTDGPTNGAGNLVVGYNEFRDGASNDDRQGSHNIVAGVRNSHGSRAFGGLVLGEFNTINGAYASVSGGSENTASGLGSSVSGGSQNTANGLLGSVSGGRDNVASGDNSSVSGGDSNTASGETSSVSGGQFNRALRLYSSVSGGQSNTANGEGASILGGRTNSTASSFSTIGGGSSVSGAAADRFLARGTLLAP